MNDRTHVEIYQDEEGDFRWRLRADNGQVIATAGEGFHDEREAVANLDRVTTAFRTDLVIERVP